MLCKKRGAITRVAGFPTSRTLGRVEGCRAITALRRCRRMAAEPAVAAGAASGANGGTEAKGDDAGVQSLRSSPLPPPFQQREPAASISPLARSSTGSPLERDVPLSQTVQPADSSTSKGAARPPGRLARACSRQKLDISSVSTKRKPSGEDPEATFQVCANSMAARQLFYLLPCFPRHRRCRVSLSPTHGLPTPFVPCLLSAMCCTPSAPSLRPALSAGRDARHLGEDRCVPTG